MRIMEVHNGAFKMRYLLCILETETILDTIGGIAQWKSGSGSSRSTGVFIEDNWEGITQLGGYRW